MEKIYSRYSFCTKSLNNSDPCIGCWDYKPGHCESGWCTKGKNVQQENIPQKRYEGLRSDGGKVKKR